MLAKSPYEPDRGLWSKLNRRLVQWRYASPLNVRPAKPILSLTFDDCPASAVNVGTRIIDQYRAKACYYIASEMLDTNTVMGRILSRQDVKSLSHSGHEIAAHTHSHIDCARHTEAVVLADIDRNLSELNDITQGDDISSFAFPFGETTFSLKQRLADRFTSLRGVLPGSNRGLVDRTQLRAFEIDGSGRSLDRLFTALKASLTAPAWIIMFTHDVSETPSGFGITPKQLTSLLDFASANGVVIETPKNVMQSLNTGSI